MNHRSATRAFLVYQQHNKAADTADAARLADRFYYLHHYHYNTRMKTIG